MSFFTTILTIGEVTHTGGQIHEIDVGNLLMNSSFLFLMFSMIFYWAQTFFKTKMVSFVESNNLVQIFDLKREKNQRFSIQRIGRLCMMIANISLFSLLVLRWKESGHFPLSNLYESLIFLSWAFTTIHLILETRTSIPFLGAMTSPSALLTNAFATFSLPADMQQSSPLVPALQSNWLMMHVTVMIVSYAALICGSLISMAFLMFSKNLPDSLFSKDSTETVEFGSNLRFENASNGISTFDPTNIERKPFDQNDRLGNEFPNVFSAQTSPLEINFQGIPGSKKLKFAQTLDSLSYRVLGFGFPFLTIGILSGAVWANEAWGSYWSWDPKETWALLTWLVFAIYLHTRFSKGWSGKRPAVIASFGFIVVWICYLGVNLMGEGLHSYGWIHS